MFSLSQKCQYEPNSSFLQQAAPEEKYEVKMCVEEAAVIVTAEKDIKTTCTITLTSPIMREEGAVEGGMKQQSGVILWGTLLCGCPGLTPNFLSEEHFHQIFSGDFQSLFIWLLYLIIILMCVKCSRYMQFIVFTEVKVAKSVEA